MRSRSARLAVFACFAATALAAARAHADAPLSPAQQCATEAEKAQALRRQSRLLEAREMFRSCSRTECPSFVAQDCVRWEDEVQTALPSIVPGARDDAERDLTDVRLAIDGRAISQPLDGRAFELDPGRRELVFQRAGFPAIHETIVVREGEKNRLVVVRWSAPGPATPAVVPAKTGEAGETAAPAARPTPPWVWALGAAGITLGGVGAGFALAADARYHDLQSSCGTTRACDAAEVSRTKTRLWAGDVAIVVGAAAVATAVWMILSPAPSSAPR